MALPPSGQITLYQIGQELGQPASNLSLRGLSAMVGKSTPDAMSEFYSVQMTINWEFNLVISSGYGYIYMWNVTTDTFAGYGDSLGYNSGTFTANAGDEIYVVTYCEPSPPEGFIWSQIDVYDSNYNSIQFASNNGGDESIANIQLFFTVPSTGSPIIINASSSTV